MADHFNQDDSGELERVVIPIGRGKKGKGGGDDEGGDRPPWPTGEDCPVKPLGKSGGQFVFMSPSGEIHSIKAKDLASPPVIVALFDGHTYWLKRHFADQRLGWSNTAAQMWLVQQCVSRRYFQAADRLRGPGAWRLGDGSLLLHLGHELRILSERRSPEVMEAGRAFGRYIYPSAPADPVPADVAASEPEVDQLFTLLGSWRWGHPGDARVLLGWLGCGYLAGAMKWRPHIWVTGDTGTGKSTLEKLIRGLAGDGALSAADPTKMAIAQRLAGKACIVLLDEFERDLDAAKQDSVVELARLGSTDDQAGIIRGSPEGVVRTYRIRAAFFFSSILRAQLKPQDTTRIYIADLEPLPPITQETRVHLSAIKRLGESLGPKLQRRALDGYWRFLQNEEVYEAAIVETWARGGRIVDQMGTLLAMAHTLLRDGVATPAEARAALTGFEPSDIIGHADESEALQCAVHILSASLVDDTTSAKAQRSVGEVISHIVQQSGDGTIWNGADHQLLRRHGIAVVHLTGGELAVAFANKHQGLNRLLAGTRWVDGVWSQVLRKIDGGGASKNGIWFAGIQVRAAVVPFDALPIGNAGDGGDVAILKPASGAPFET